MIPRRTVLALLTLPLLGVLGSSLSAQKGGSPPPNPAIAFLSSGALKLMNADGSNVTTLVRSGVTGQPCWSGDSTRLAFPGTSATMVINRDGTGLRSLPLPGNPWTRIDWSRGPTPDGSPKILACDHFNDEMVVWIVNPDGTGLQRLFDHVFLPRAICWNRDSDGVVVIGRGSASETSHTVNEIPVVARPGGGLDLDLANRRILCTVPSVWIWELRCSNMTNMVTFASEGYSGGYRVMVLDLDQANPVAQQVSYGGGAAASDRCPSFSPDDQQLVFSRSGTGRQGDGILIVHRNGTGELRISGTTGTPCWKR